MIHKHNSTITSQSSPNKAREASRPSIQRAIVEEEILFLPRLYSIHVPTPQHGRVTFVGAMTTQSPQNERLQRSCNHTAHFKEELELKGLWCVTWANFQCRMRSIMWGSNYFPQLTHSLPLSHTHCCPILDKQKAKEYRVPEKAATKRHSLQR